MDSQRGFKIKLIRIESHKNLTRFDLNNELGPRGQLDYHREDCRLSRMGGFTRKW